MKLGLILALSGSIGLIYKPSEIMGPAIGIGLMTLLVGVLVRRVEDCLFDGVSEDAEGREVNFKDIDGGVRKLK